MHATCICTKVPFPHQAMNTPAVLLGRPGLVLTGVTGAVSIILTENVFSLCFFPKQIIER